jgi:drug/metabolite transporter (DMT)-like permease
LGNVDEPGLLRSCRIMLAAAMAHETDSARPTDRLQLLAAAFLFSTGGAAIKACTLTSWQIAASRAGIAAAALLLMLPATRRGWSLRLLPVAAAFAATTLLFVVCNKLTTAASTIFLQATAPLYIVLLGPWLLREKIRRSDLAYMTALAAGMALFFVGRQPAAATAPYPVLGNILAAGAGLCWGLTIIGLRWLGRHAAAGEDPSAAAVVSGNLLACLIALPFALPVVESRPTDWLLVTFLGIFQIGLAYVFLTRGVRRVTALEASLLLLLEPMLNPLWALVVHGERPGQWAAVGGAIIILATAISTLAKARRDT